MPDLQLAPLDASITIDQLTLDPYPIYKRLRAEQPVTVIDIDTIINSNELFK